MYANRTFGGGRSDASWTADAALGPSPTPQFDTLGGSGAAANPSGYASSSTKSEIEKLRLEMVTQRREFERRLADVELEKARAEAELTQLRAHNASIQGTLDSIMAQRTKDSRDRTDGVRQLEELRSENLRLRKELGNALDSKLSGLRTPMVSLDQYMQLLQIAEQLMAVLGDGASLAGGVGTTNTGGVATARAWIEMQARAALDGSATPAVRAAAGESSLSRAQSILPTDSASIAALRLPGKSSVMETPRPSGGPNTLLPSWNEDQGTTLGAPSVAGLSALGSVSARESVSQTQALKRQSGTARVAEAAPVREELVEHGLLVKLITDANPGKQWAFENTSTNIQYILDFTFGPQSEVVALGDTHVDGRLYRITLYPGETKDFIRGIVNGYRMSIQYGEPDANFVRATSITDKELVRVVDRVRDLRANGAEETMRLCGSNGLPFVDISFPPLTKSMARADEGEGPTVRWERTKDVVPTGERMELCLSGFEAAGPIRAVPHGWLASSMVTLALRRTEIVRCFSRTSAADQAGGLYRVNLNVGGWWQTVLVDSFVPCSPNATAEGFFVPYGCRCASPRDVWPTVLEKAIAKTMGSYAALGSGGDPLENMADVSGGICERLDWRGRDGSTFNAFLKTFKQNLCVLMTVPHDNNVPESERGRMNPIGFRAGQAYAVLAAVLCDDYRLCLISNPEGASSWSGSWSPKSENWIRQPAVKAACSEAERQVTVPLNGAIWMEWRDVSFNFGGAGLLKLRPSWLDIRIPNRFHGVRPMWILEVSVRKNSGIIIGVHQKDRRLLDANDMDRSYSAFLLTCVAANENGVWDAIAQSHGGTFWRGRDVHLEMALTPRDRPYYILPRRYTEERDRDTVVSVQIENRDGVSLALKQPTEEIMNAVRYSPVWKFDPSPCPTVQPTPPCQIDRQDATSLTW